MWVEELRLTGFRNYQAARIAAGPGPVVITGPNGSGKTNLLEAVSMLAPGQGLRRAAYDEITRQSGPEPGWSVWARVATPDGPVEVGTGIDGRAGDETGRIVRLNGKSQSGSGVLAEYVEMLWLTPAMDGLFTGPASERRRFLDRMVLCFDASYRTSAAQFERAMRQRNRLLEDDVADGARFDGLETVMAEAGTAVAAARAAAVTRIAATIATRRIRSPDLPFPWATVAIEGRLEAEIASRPSLEVEDHYRRMLKDGRGRDRAAGRTLEGPHRSDLLVGHGPKGMPARLSSTGEQKALLVGLILAQAELVCAARGGSPPILLLDEIAAHLDAERRAALFGELIALGTQAWMTGTDRPAFSALEAKALFLDVRDGRLEAAA